MRVAICIPARGQMEVTTAFDLTRMAAYMAVKKNIDLNQVLSIVRLLMDLKCLRL
jgi:hypothetical protein